MSRALSDLHPDFRPFANDLLARFTEAGIAVAIVCTRRTDAEQAAAFASGHSKVTHSWHQDGRAIDVCPYYTWELHGADKLQWDTNDPAWLKMGLIGESIGMRWGGRFTPLDHNGIGWDAGHFEKPLLSTDVLHV